MGLTAKAQKRRYIALIKIMITAPICEPTISEVKPIINGMIAPPKTPVIIKPEISLAFSGIDCMAIEKIIENTLAMEKPIIANKEKTRILSNEKIRPINAKTAIKVLNLKNFAEGNLANKIAPKNAPAVRNAKYILGP